MMNWHNRRSSLACIAMMAGLLAIRFAHAEDIVSNISVVGRPVETQQSNGFADEVAARVASYVDAFNKQDVDATAEHWSDHGEYLVAGSSDPVVGRDAIKDALARLLDTDESFRLSVGNQRFRKVSETVVLEDGLAKLVSEKHGCEYASYVVVHVKKDDTWYRDSTRETALGAWRTSESEMQSLGDLVGNWNSKTGGGSLTVQAEWMHDQRFIQRSFRFRGKDDEAVTATETIGWDPATGTLRSWSFDSQGGFEQATWSRDNDKWLIKASAVLPNGMKATEQRSLMVDSDGNLLTQIIQQQFDGRLMPGSQPVTLVRQTAPQNSNPDRQEGDTP